MIDTTKNIQLFLGNCCEIMKEIPDKSIDLILTDPPYNCGIKKFEIKEKSYKRISQAWDSYTKEEYKNLMLNIFKEGKRVLKEGGTILVTGMFQNAFDIHIWLRDELGFTFRNFITWFKNNAMPIKFAKQIGCYAYSCEYINYFTNGHKTNTFNYDEAKQLNNNKQQRDVLNFKVCQDIKSGHPSQKPLSLWRYLVKIHSKENNVVLDPFIGSGTTAVVCKELNRKCIGIEISEEYMQMAQKRLEGVGLNEN